MNKSRLFLAATGALVLICAAAAPNTQAASIPGFGVYASAGEPSRKTTRKRNGNTAERRTTRTGRNGNTATREARRTVDRDNQTVRTERRATGPNGRSATSDSTLSRTEDGYNRNTTVTGPEGRTAHRNTDVSYDPETGVTRDRVTTGPNGGEWTRNDNAQWDPDTQTYTRNSSRTTPDGREQSVDVTARRTETGATRSATRTRADGTEVTRTQEVERKDADD
ncbi:MAG: hypothetical protein AAF545_11710 [Pseudomonadota bacterium]